MIKKIIIGSNAYYIDEQFVDKMSLYNEQRNIELSEAVYDRSSGKILKYRAGIENILDKIYTPAN